MKSNYSKLNETYLAKYQVKENFVDLMNVFYGFTWAQGSSGKFHYY